MSDPYSDAVGTNSEQFVVLGHNSFSAVKVKFNFVWFMIVIVKVSLFVEKKCTLFIFV